MGTLGPKHILFGYMDPHIVEESNTVVKKKGVTVWDSVYLLVESPGELKVNLWESIGIKPQKG